MASSATSGRRKPGSQPALRSANVQRVITALERRGPTTQAKLARLTGLSTGTISNIVRELDGANRVRTTRVIDSGRRAVSVSLLGDERAFVGIDLSWDEVRVLVARSDRSVLARAARTRPASATPEQTLEVAERLATEALTEAGLTADQVFGTVAGVAPMGPSPTGDWSPRHLARLAARQFGSHVQIEPAATLGALAQITWGPYDIADSLAYLHLGQEVSSGLLVGESPIRGHLGAAGLLAHLTVVTPGEVCHCGNRGCLSTVVSHAKLLQGVRRAKRSPRLELEDVINLVRVRDLPTVRLVEDLGIHLGQAAAVVCTLVNPAVIVLGGPLAAMGAPLLDPVGRGLRRRLAPTLADGTTLTACQLGADAVAMGGCALAIRRAAISA